MAFNKLGIEKYNTYISHCKIIFVVVTAFSFFNSSAHAAQNECYVVPPYVIHVDHTSAMIVWVTPEGTPSGEVLVQDEYGGQEQRIDAEVTMPGFHQVDLNNPNLYHDLDIQRQLVKIEKLQPYTNYVYLVSCGDGQTTSTGSFITAPEPGVGQKFTFVGAADAHANRQGGSYYRPIAEAVGKEEPDFMIHAGDYKGQSGSHWSSWPAYFRVGRPYLEKTVHWPVVGGHDVNKARNFRALFAFNDPDGDPADEDNAGTWYTFTYGNTQFFVLDHVYDKDLQLKWLKQKLAESIAEWKIVAIHEMQMTVGGFPRLLGGIFRDFALAFEEYGVDVVLSGHNHIYERILPLAPNGVKPVNYVSVNSGGFNTLAERPSPIIASGGISNLNLNYAHFSIDGNHLVMEAKKADGTVIDRMELIKGEDGMYQDEVMDQAVDVDLALEIAHIYSGDYSERDVREDLAAEFTAIPEADKTFEVILDVGRFPIGSELVVYEQQHPEGWRVDGQTIEVTDETISLEVTAPENLERTDVDFKPPFKLMLNLRLDDRDFTPSPVNPVVKIGPKSIYQPDLISPSSLATVSRRPEFTWEKLRYATEYQFMLTRSNFATPSDILMDTTLSETGFIYPSELEGDQSYRWRVRGFNEISTGPWSNVPLFFTEQVTSVESGGDIPSEFMLDQNYPNPFNPSTNIRFSLPVESFVRITLFDSIGRMVAVLFEDEIHTGHHNIRYNAANVSSGLYLYRMEAFPMDGSIQNAFIQTKKMTVIN